MKVGNWWFANLCLPIIKLVREVVSSKFSYLVTGEGGGGNGVYVVKLEFDGSGKLLLGASAFAAAQDTEGNNLLIDNNWTFNRDNDNQITITHPLSNFAIILMTHSDLNSSNTYLSKPILANSQFSNTTLQNESSQDTITIPGLTTGNTGLNSSGTFIYVTRQFPENNILIE